MTTDLTATQLNLFFSTIWTPGDIVEVRAIWPERTGPAPRSIWRPAGEWVAGTDTDQLDRLNREGWNLYAGVLPRTAAGARGNANVLPGAVLWADIDHVTAEVAEERLAASGLPEPSVIVNSGHGIQCYWLLTEKRPPAELRGLVGDIAALLGSDPSVRNEERVLRIPGFVNHKPPAADAELLVCDPERCFEYDEIRALAPMAPAKPAHVSGDRAAATMPMAGVDDGMLERARRYLAMIPGSGPGGRTTAAFKAAAALVKDYALDHGVALDLLTRWDLAANTPPIQEDPQYGPDELGKIVVNAGRYGKHAPGTLVDASGADDGFDIGAFVARAAGGEEPAEPVDTTGRIPDPGLFPQELLRVPGFMGELARYIDEKNHKSQPVLALGAALVAMGTLAGRKVEGVTGLRTNFYVLGVIPSGEGKNAPREELSQLLHDPDNLFYYAVDRLKSGAGIRGALEVNPCTVFLLDEIGEFLEMIKNAKNHFWIKEIIPELMTLYSSAASPHVKMGGYGDVKKTITLSCPHVCLFGTSVPGSFFQAMTMSSVTSGFIGRLTIFEGALENPPKKRASRAPMPESLLATAKWWREFAPNGMLTGTHAGSVSKPITVDESAEATAIFDQCEREARGDIEKFGREWGGPYNRTEENARKLAIAYACSECKERPFIGAAAAEWGSKLSLHLTRRLVYLASINVADNDTHDKKNRVLRIILNAGRQGIRHSHLYGKCRWLKGPEFNDIVNSLIVAQDIQVEEIGTKTKPLRIYYING